MIKQYFINYFYFPYLHNLIYKDNFYNIFKEFEEMQWKTKKKIELYQKERLNKILNYAIKQIPYYNKFELIVNENSAINDLKRFPILTKEIIRKEFSNLIQIEPENKQFNNFSGGSTGEPIKIVQDKYVNSNSICMDLVNYKWTGYKIGNNIIKLWGKTKEQISFLHHGLYNWIWSIKILDAHMLNKKRIDRYIRIINKKNKKIIIGYVQPLFEISKYVIQNNIGISPPISIISCAGVLDNYTRITIEKAFKCKVFNKYASKEIGSIAFECEKHNGLHENMFCNYIEILNDKLMPCRDLEIGDIYITSLINYSMPLIRYKIGDKGSFKKEKCKCGRGLKLLNNIIGRDNDILINNKNEIINSSLINNIFYSKKTIARYQVIQINRDNITVKIESSENKNNQLLKDEINQIRKNLIKIFGGNCRIKFSVVKRILPTKSGKYRFTIRLLNNKK